MKRKSENQSKDYWLSICSWCAYQERSQKETRRKLAEMGAEEDHAEEMIARLIQENFINEERFAKLYAGGKFRLKKWGKLKIQYGLKKHEISNYCINSALMEIDSNEYQETIEKLFQMKSKELGHLDSRKRDYKISQFLIAKGYESDFVWQLLNK